MSIAITVIGIFDQPITVQNPGSNVEDTCTVVAPVF